MGAEIGRECRFRGFHGFGFEDGASGCNNAGFPVSDPGGPMEAHDIFPCFFWCAMLKDRTRIERQLSLSQQQLSAWESQLEQQGVTGKAKSKNATWRHLNADHRQLKRRLIAVAALEAREAAVVQRRAEKEATAQSAEG
ncbi:MAG: hypothetical protein RLZZ436_1757 [Planctomycetota bacterium]